MSNILARKVVSASISSSLFAIILALIHPNPFEELLLNFINYFFHVSIAIPAYLMFSFPFFLIYGVFTSVISDKIAQFIATKIGKEASEIVISAIFHLIFGILFYFYSLIAATLFFVTDRILNRWNQDYKWQQALKSLALPLLVWIFFMGIVYIEHVITDF